MCDAKPSELLLVDIEAEENCKAYIILLHEMEELQEICAGKVFTL